MFNHIKYADKATMRRSWVRFKKTAAFTFLAYVVVYVLTEASKTQNFTELQEALTSSTMWFNIVQGLIASLLSGGFYGATKLSAGAKINEYRMISEEG